MAKWGEVAPTLALGTSEGGTCSWVFDGASVLCPDEGRTGSVTGGARSESLESSRQCGGHSRELHLASTTESISGGARMVNHHFLLPVLLSFTLFLMVTEEPASGGRVEVIALLTVSSGQENLVPHTILKGRGGLNWNGGEELSDEEGMSEEGSLAPEGLNIGFGGLKTAFFRAATSCTSLVFTSSSEVT